MNKTNQLPIVIDADLIADMRRNGQWPEAEKLLKAFHKDIRGD